MAQGWSKQFYNSSHWQKQRIYILQRDNFMCTEPGCRRPAEEVHHIIELTEENINDLNICLNENNLRSLCGQCHKRITKEMHSKGSILPRVGFDEDGYPIEIR